MGNLTLHAPTPRSQRITRLGLQCDHGHSINNARQFEWPIRVRRGAYETQAVEPVGCAGTLSALRRMACRRSTRAAQGRAFFRRTRDYFRRIGALVRPKFKIQRLGTIPTQPEVFNRSPLPARSGEKPTITEVLEWCTTERVGAL